MITSLISILDIDQQIFQFINRDISNVMFDYIMPAIREKLIWLPFYVFLIAFMMVNYRFPVAIYFITAIVMTIGLSDFTSSKVIKDNVERLRPCNDPDLSDVVKLRVVCGRGYSFTSSHAANHFALAFFLIYTLGRFFRKLRWPLIIWALAISFAQVYVGVHYPFDVFFGGLLGMGIGMLMALGYNKFVTDSIYQE